MKTPPATFTALPRTLPRALHLDLPRALLAPVTRALLAALLLFGLLAGGTATAADPVQARKDLQAMGLKYNEQDFAKAAGSGDLTAVTLFLDAGMDVNAGGGAAIGLAAGRGQAKMVEFLLAKGARATSNALQYARTRGHKDIEKMLVAAGARE